MSVTSTVPAAVQTLAAYMQAVATANPTLNPGVYTDGIPTASVRDNYLMVGNWETGELFSPQSYKWATIPGNAKLRTEEYALQGAIRCWTGGVKPLDRLTDAFTLLNGLHQQILNDIGGNVATAGALSPSGSWGDLDVTMQANGPLRGKGWGVVLGFELHVKNVQLQG